jgi:hypothetical protein
VNIGAALEELNQQGMAAPVPLKDFDGVAIFPGLMAVRELGT